MSGEVWQRRYVFPLCFLTIFTYAELPGYTLGSVFRTFASGDVLAEMLLTSCVTEAPYKSAASIIGNDVRSKDRNSPIREITIR